MDTCEECGNPLGPFNIGWVCRACQKKQATDDHDKEQLDG